MDKVVRRLARSIGIDVDDALIVRLLEQEHLVAADAGLVLERTRHAIDNAFRTKVIPTVEIDHGGYTYRKARVRDLLEWAVDRPERYRYVDEERARRYAEEDARGSGK